MPSQLLNVTEERRGDVVVFHFTSRRPDGLNACLKKVLSEGSTRVVADLSEVKWVDGGFVTSLLFSMVMVADLGGKMLAASLQPEVLELLRKMKIDPYPPPWVCDTVDEAVKVLTGTESEQ